jgi:selenocysteine-specific elongation factor
VLTYAAGDELARATVTAGIAALVEAAAAQGRLARRSADRPLKLSIDRSFTIRGFGTVVTGTTASGRLAAGDTVVLLPSGVTGRVRGLQVHEEAVDRVGPGSRAAVNLQGVDNADVSRGEILSHPGALRVTSMIDCTFTALKRLPKPLEDRARVLVHIGTAQVEGTLAFLGQHLLAPGASAPAQLRLDTPIAMLPGEPFVARGFATLESYGTTIGGGVAHMPQRRRHRRTSEAGLTLIEALAAGAADPMVEAAVAFEGDVGLVAAELHASLPLERAVADAAVAAALATGSIVRAGDRLYGHASADRLGALALETVAAYHAANPAWPGIRPEELRTRVRAELPQDYFTALLDRLVAAGALARRGDVVAQPSFAPRRSAKQEQACTQVLAALTEGGLTPARVQDLPETLRLPPAEVAEALELLHQGGEAVRVSKELSYAAAPLAALREELVAYLSEHPAMDTAAWKEMTGASRKWTIPLGEYFDRIRLTIRVGDQRRLRS